MQRSSLKGQSKHKTIPIKKMKFNSNITETANNLEDKKENNCIGSLINNQPELPIDNIDNEDATGLTAQQQQASIPSEGNNRKNIRVYARIRPVNEVERDLIANNVGCLCLENIAGYNKNNTVVVRNATGVATSPFTFDQIFPSETAQVSVYNVVGKEIVQDVLSGYNGTIFAYGQSGSGKTHTMYGQDIYDEESKGIIPRLVNDIFNHVSTAGENVTFELKMSILQIYKEMICDLITGEKDLKIKENPIKGIYVDKLTEVYVNSIETFMEYIDLANENRFVSETKLNSTSSRSHSILIFEVTQTFRNESFTKKGTLNLVDLAGSEKISKTGAVGETLEEAKKINLSLSSLGHVIHSLTSGSDHIPYRDSKLTRILKESLGGNFKTSLIVTCSPHSYHFEETVSSFQFASRAKSIKNKAKMNIKLSYEELQKIITQLRKDLSKAHKEIGRLKELIPLGTEINIISIDEDPELKKASSFKDILTSATQELNNLLTEGEPIIKERSPNKCHSLSRIGLTNNTTFPKSESGDKTAGDLLENLEKTEQEILLSINPDKCQSCAKSNEIIQQLKKLIRQINDELKEKESIISTLDSSNQSKSKQIEELKEKTKAGHVKRNSNLLENNTITQTTKPTNELYEDIKDKLNSIEMKQCELNKIEVKMSHLGEMTHQLSNNISNLFNKNLKNSFEQSSNGHLLLMNSASSMLSKTLGIYKDETSSDFTFNSTVEVFKEKTGEIFDSIFKFAQYDYNNNNDNDALIDQTKQLKKKLLDFASLFLFGYISSYSNLQISLQLNYKTKNQNNILKNIISILISIVEDLLRTNIDIGQKCTMLNIEKLKSSFLGLIPNQAYDCNNPDNNLKASIINESANPNLFRRTSGRISTLINRKGQEAIKALRDHVDMQNNNLLNNLNELKNSFEKKNAQTNNTINVNPVNNHLSNKGLLPKIEKIPRRGSIEIINKTISACTCGANNSVMLNSFVKKQDKKRSKLTIMKEFVIKAIQQTDNYKHEVTMLKEDLYNVIQVTQKTILKKLLENGQIKDAGIDEVIFLNNKETNINPLEINEILEEEDDGNETHKMNSVKKSRNTVQPQQMHHTSYSYAIIEDKSKAITHRSIFTFDNDKSPGLRYNGGSFDFSDNKRSSLFKEKNIEDLIEDYLETGTATRKFDGIDVKYIGSKMRCSYNSGLNANNFINAIPLRNKLECNAGDESEVSYENDEDDN